MTSPKASLLTRMNTLKGVVDESLLTEAQSDAHQEIVKHRENGARFINLHGPRDAGKTFLCWVLQLSDPWEYYQALPEDPDSPAVIYDHGSSDRRATRELRNHASITGIATVVYVTEQPASELYPRVELRPDDDNYEQISETWEGLGIKRKQQNKPTNQ